MLEYTFEDHMITREIAFPYVPWQKFNGIYDDLEKAFNNGTIFPELDKPFWGSRCCK